MLIIYKRKESSFVEEERTFGPPHRDLRTRRDEALITSPA